MRPAASAEGPSVISIFQNTSILSKVVAGTLVIGYLIPITGLFPSALGYLALVPGRTLPCAWNLLTYALVTPSFVELITSLLGWLILCKVVEPVYGGRGLLVLILFLVFATGILTFITVFIIYVATRSAPVLYSELSGFHGVLAGMLVAVKQIMPDQELALFGLFKFRGRHLPGLYLLITTPIGFLSRPLEVLPFVFYGAYTTWFYLRFLQYNNETKLRGDPSQDFSFASFFPTTMQPFVDKAVGVFWTPKFGLAREQPSGHVLGGSSLTGSDDHDAARRRERGARALEERIKKQKEIDIENQQGQENS